MSSPVEIEVKLGLKSAVAHADLLQALPGARASGALQQQRNRFFDGPQGEISAARIAVRVREERRPKGDGESVRTVLTLKRSGVTRGPIHERIEWEEEITPALAEIEAEPSLLLSLPGAPSTELRRLVPGLGTLVCLGGFENERREAEVMLEIPDADGIPRTVATRWEIDRTRFAPGPTEYELEVELPPAARALGLTAEALVAAVKARLAALGVETCEQPESKYARFRRHVLGRED